MGYTDLLRHVEESRYVEGVHYMNLLAHGRAVRPGDRVVFPARVNDDRWPLPSEQGGYDARHPFASSRRGNGDEVPFMPVIPDRLRLRSVGVPEQQTVRWRRLEAYDRTHSADPVNETGQYPSRCGGSWPQFGASDFFFGQEVTGETSLQHRASGDEFLPILRPASLVDPPSRLSSPASWLGRGSRRPCSFRVRHAIASTWALPWFGPPVRR